MYNAGQQKIKEGRWQNLSYSEWVGDCGCSRTDLGSDGIFMGFLVFPILHAFFISSYLLLCSIHCSQSFFKSATSFCKTVSFSWIVLCFTNRLCLICFVLVSTASNKVFYNASKVIPVTFGGGLLLYFMTLSKLVLSKNSKSIIIKVSHWLRNRPKS